MATSGRHATAPEAQPELQSPAEPSAELYRPASRPGFRGAWISWALRELFQDRAIASNLLFKGGTSLAEIHDLSSFDDMLAEIAKAQATINQL